MGMSLIAEIGCPVGLKDIVLSVARQERCKTFVKEERGRAVVWIYRRNAALGIIQEIAARKSTPRSLDVWAMGKLFGYSDAAVLAFIERNIK